MPHEQIAKKGFIQFDNGIIYSVGGMMHDCDFVTKSAIGPND